MIKPTLTDQITTWRQEAEELSYEEALVALDLLLAELQNDSVPIEELQRHYLRGQVYLNHCEKLLESVEQAVVQLDPETLETITNPESVESDA